MAFDLELTNNGDFILSKQLRYPRFRVSWHDTEFPVCRIRFYNDQVTPRPEPLSHKTETTVNTNGQYVVTTVIEGIEYSIIINAAGTEIFSVRSHVDLTDEADIEGLSFTVKGFRYTLEYIDDKFRLVPLKFRLSFHSMDPLVRGKYKINSVEDTQELKQRIRSLLRIEYGEFRFQPELGSYLATMKHKDLHANATIQGVYSIVMNVLNEFGDDFSVIVAPKKVDGPFYCQNLNIYVYKSNKLLFELPL